MLSSSAEQKKKLYGVVDVSVVWVMTTVKASLEQMRDARVLNPPEQHAISWSLSSAIQVVRPVVLLLIK